MFISQNIRFKPVFNEAFVSTGKTAFAPYGFCYVAPSGSKGIALPCEDGDITVAYEMPQKNLNEGEVEIFSLGGASIKLKNDGSVVINGLVITSDGRIPSISASGGTGSDASGDDEEDNGSIFE